MLTLLKATWVSTGDNRLPCLALTDTCQSHAARGGGHTVRTSMVAAWKHSTQSALHRMLKRSSFDNGDLLLGSIFSCIYLSKPTSTNDLVPPPGGGTSICLFAMGRSPTVDSYRRSD